MGWIVVWVLGVCAVLAVLANHRYHWASGWRYSRRARHQALPEVWPPEPERDPFGSMCLEDDPRGPEILERALAFGDVSGPPEGMTWREQTAADLSPEALDDEALDELDQYIRLPSLGTWLPAPPRSPSRLADTGDVMDAHLAADVTAFMSRQDAEVAADIAVRADECRAYVRALAVAL